MRLVFFGSGAFGLPTLEALARKHEIAAVVTQPDRPAGRGGKPTATPIGAWVSENLGGAALIKPEDVNAPDVVARVRGLRAEAWVVVAFGQKLGKPLLAGPTGSEPVFAINLHASLLPRWRGAGPIAAAIMAGDVRTGNSVITIAERMDAGLVLGQSTRAIEPSMTAGELHDLLAADGPGLIECVLAGHAVGTLKPVAQDERAVTKAGKLSKASGRVDFGRAAELLRRQIHALTPWPGVAVGFEGIGGSPVKLLRVQVAEATGQQEPGRLADVVGGVVGCGEGTGLRLLEVQPAGRRAMKWEDFVRGAGRMLSVGARVDSAKEGS